MLALLSIHNLDVQHQNSRFFSTFSLSLSSMTKKIVITFSLLKFGVKKTKKERDGQRRKRSFGSRSAMAKWTLKSLRPVWWLLAVWFCCCCDPVRCRSPASAGVAQPPPSYRNFMQSPEALKFLAANLRDHYITNAAANLR